MGLAVLVALAVVGNAAVANGPTFTVSYRVGPECPNQATFEAAILARAPHARKAEVGIEPQVQIDADLIAAPRLRVTTRDGTSQDREIVAEGCTEAMQSMAIIAAMILEAQLEPPTPPEPPPPVVTEPPPPPMLRSETPAPTVPVASARRVGWGVSVGGAAESAAAPKLAFGATAGVEVRSPARDVVTPSARLSVVLAQAARVEADAGDARFRLLLGRAHLCGLRLAAGPSSYRFCGLLEGGALYGQGLEARNERSRTMPWLGAGLAALGAVELSGPMSLELGVGGRALIFRDRFVFAPQELVHQVPDFAWNLSVGLHYALF